MGRAASKEDAPTNLKTAPIGATGMLLITPAHKGYIIYNKKKLREIHFLNLGRLSCASPMFFYH